MSRRLYHTFRIVRKLFSRKQGPAPVATPPATRTILINYPSKTITLEVPA